MTFSAISRSATDLETLTTPDRRVDGDGLIIRARIAGGHRDIGLGSGPSTPATTIRFNMSAQQEDCES
ncbi:MAG: hypothetical protein ACKOQ3_08675 [Novosphingobium sp.]